MLQAELDSEDGHVWGWLDSQGELAALSQGVLGDSANRNRDFSTATGKNGSVPAESGRKKDPGIMARIYGDVTAHWQSAISLNEECPLPADGSPG